MIINLAETEFENDIFTAMLPDGSTMTLNKLDEKLDDGAEGCIIQGINIEIEDTEGNLITCPCVIGMGNEFMQITTDYTQYEGEELTPSNMAFCQIEVYED
jgi:hypothetical protein